MNENSLMELYFNYDVEEDPTGKIGYWIAEQVWKRYGPDLKEMTLKIMLKKLERTVLLNQ